MTSDPPGPHLSDARELRALAHPLRMRLLEELALGDALTATDLSKLTGESPANCSWHLRQLAKFGYVEEGPPAAGRRRPWRLVMEPRSWPDESTGEDAEVSRALREMILQRELIALREQSRKIRHDEPEWQEAAFVTQSFAWLTPSELREVDAAVRKILERHAGRFADPDTRPPGSRAVRVVAWGIPARGSEST